MKPSVALEMKRAEVRAATGRFRAANPRVFGSVLHGTDQDGSDLDLLIDALPGATLFDLGGLQVELEDLLGVRVDLLTPGDLPPKMREKVLAEARPVTERGPPRRLSRSHPESSVRCAKLCRGTEQGKFPRRYTHSSGRHHEPCHHWRSRHQDNGTASGFRRTPRGNILAKHARYAQPRRSRLLRHRISMLCGIRYRRRCQRSWSNYPDSQRRRSRIIGSGETAQIAPTSPPQRQSPGCQLHFSGASSRPPRPRAENQRQARSGIRRAPARIRKGKKWPISSASRSIRPTPPTRCCTR